MSQTLQYAQTGNVDVALVALALVLGTQGGHHTVIPQELYNPIDQALGVVSSSKHIPESRALVRFVTGEQGEAILERYGFTIPKEDPAP